MMLEWFYFAFIALAWWRCCCGIPACNFCDDPSPDTITVRLQNVADADCGDCTDYNTNDIVCSRVAPGCFWIGQPYCTDTAVTVAIYLHDASNIRWEVTVDSDVKFVLIEDISGGPVDCTANRTLTLSFGFDTGECDWTAATCEINP